MKLKQRLAFGTFCGFLFFATKPLWDWDDPEWRPRHRRHHGLIHRMDHADLHQRETDGFLHSKLHGPNFEEHKKEIHESKSDATVKEVPKPVPTVKVAIPKIVSKIETTKPSTIPPKVETSKIVDNFHADLAAIKEIKPKVDLPRLPRVTSHAPVIPVEPVKVEPVNSIEADASYHSPEDHVEELGQAAFPVQSVVALPVQPVAVLPVQPVVALPVKPVVALPVQPVVPLPVQPVVALPVQPVSVVQPVVTEKPSKVYPSIKLDMGVTDDKIKQEMNRIKVVMTGKCPEKPWEVAKGWVRPKGRLLYPYMHPQIGCILNHMSTIPIKKADVLPKGTQLKMLLYLEGNQKAVFKPMRYERDHVIEGNAWDGYDRHNAEIAAFHLDRVLNFRRAPLVTGRRINLISEILPIAADRLSETFKQKDGNECFYGQCFYCKETELACAVNGVLEGSLTLWFPDDKPLEKVRHPYQRTYKEDKKSRWETDEQYCNNYVKKTAPYDSGNRLLDLIDTAIFDFLIGNADRHHYEVFANIPDSMIILMDNAKAFGNPNLDELSILAPLRQCCLIRLSTFERLATLKSGLLTKLLIEALKTEKLAPILHKKHIEAINRRMPIIFQAIQTCVSVHSKDAVLLESWLGLNAATDL